MKKLVLTMAMILTMGLVASAQDGGGMLKRSQSYKETYRVTSREGGQGMMTPNLPAFGESNDQASGPLGSGIAVLVGLGAAYLVGKKRKED